jgi:hypothetical protein
MKQLKQDANRTTNNAAEPRDGFVMTEIGELPADWGTEPLGKALEPSQQRVKDLPAHEATALSVLSLTKPKFRLGTGG